MDTSRPIIALDFPTEKIALDFIDKFTGEKLFIKVGMELFYAAGPQLVCKLKDTGHDVFCDLKLHDIPNTVEKAAKSLSRLGADLLTVHAAGGIKMMQAALEGLNKANKRPAVVAITQLTSTSEVAMHKEQLIEASLEESVLNYARCAQTAGLDGVVCSAWEAHAIARATNSENNLDFLRITPGIRPVGADNADQKRVVTPEKAAQMYSSAIVVGRPITQASDPVAAYFRIKEAWNS